MNKKNTLENKNGYGLLSMMAMIIGIVIGSGIFIKNSSLIAVNGSVLNTIFAWIIGSLIVITTVIAFLEIISITEIKNEQSTLANWGKHLIGLNFGKFVGYFVTFAYLPIILAGLFSFASQQFVDTLVISGVLEFSEKTPFARTFFVMAIALVLIIIVGLINTITLKPGKIFQNVGTCLKTIPLFFIILLFLYMVLANINMIHFPSPDEINPEAKSYSNVPLILMSLPPILFSFDGFLVAGSLSKESRKKSIFKWAFILSMIFIIIIYMLFSIATLGLGDWTNKTPGLEYGKISNVIYNIFEVSVADVLNPVVSAIIFISILTGVSGSFIGSTRTLSDLSASNIVVDKDKQYLKKNHNGVSVSSGLVILSITLGWFFLSILFDFIIEAETGAPLVITGYMLNLAVIGVFFIYSILISGALWNRFRDKSKRVKVDKNRAFIPAAIISTILIFLITFWFAFTIIAPYEFIMSPDGIVSDGYWTEYWIKLAFFIIFIMYVIIVAIVNIHLTKDMSDNLIKDKKIQCKIYYGESFDEAAIMEEEEEPIFHLKNNKNFNSKDKKIFTQEQLNILNERFENLSIEKQKVNYEQLKINYLNIHK